MEVHLDDSELRQIRRELWEEINRDLEPLARIAKAARALLLAGYEFDWQPPGFGGEVIDRLHEALNAYPETVLPQPPEGT
jgi:hypothetical protein